MLSALEQCLKPLNCVREVAKRLIKGVFCNFGNTLRWKGFELINQLLLHGFIGIRLTHTGNQKLANGVLMETDSQDVELRADCSFRVDVVAPLGGDGSPGEVRNAVEFTDSSIDQTAAFQIHDFSRDRRFVPDIRKFPAVHLPTLVFEAGKYRDLQFLPCSHMSSPLRAVLLAHPA